MRMTTDPLDFNDDGAVLHAGAALSILSALEAELADVPPDLAGARLYNRAGLNALLDVSGPIGSLAARILGSDANAVRAILFDKTAATNWALGWHQDRTIAVKERADVAGYGPWSIKAGVHHVEPPFAVIEQMVTLRIHLDPVPADNTPLLIAPGLHRFGRVPEAHIPALVARCGSYACLADRCDVWAYRTPIVHASAAATSVTRRRVLQVDYSAERLANGLRWAGI